MMGVWIDVFLSVYIVIQYYIIISIYVYHVFLLLLLL